MWLCSYWIMYVRNRVSNAVTVAVRNNQYLYAPASYVAKWDRETQRIVFLHTIAGAFSTNFHPLKSCLFFCFVFLFPFVKEKQTKKTIKMENLKSYLLIGCSADSSHVSISERQTLSVITTETRLISSQKDKWGEWGESDMSNEILSSSKYRLNVNCLH